MCVLSQLSHVQFQATLGTVAYQAHSDNLVFTCVVFFPSGIIVIVAWAHFLERYFSCVFALFSVEGFRGSEFVTLNMSLWYSIYFKLVIF